MNKEELKKVNEVKETTKKELSEKELEKVVAGGSVGVKLGPKGGKLR